MGQTHTAVYWQRSPAGNEGAGDVDFLTSDAVVGCGIVARITGAHTTQDPELDYFLASGAQTVIEGGSTIATWGAEAGNSWLAIGSAGEDDLTISATPTDYTAPAFTKTGGGTNAGGSLAMAHRLALNAASERFSSFTVGGNDYTKGATVAIRAA